MSNQQPPNENATAQSIGNRLPLIRRFVADKSGESTQNWVPINRPHPGHDAVELDDHSVVGAVHISPANMSTSTGDQWEARINQLDEALSTTVDFEVEQYSTLRSLDNESYRKAYQRMAEARPQERDLAGIDRLQRRLLDERIEVIEDDHDSVLVREHYLLVKVMPHELAESWDDAAGLFGSATNLPLIGDHVRANRLNEYADDIDDLREELLRELGKRIDDVINTLGSVDDVSGRPVPMLEFTRLLRSHYRGDDAYSIPDETIRAVIHNSPVVGGDTDVDVDYEVDIGERDPAPDAENFRAFIAPESVRYEDQRYIVLDEETYLLGMWIENWPDNPDPGMFRDILDTQGVHITLSTHALGVSKSEARKQSQQNKVKHKADYQKKEQEGHVGAQSAYRKWQVAADIEDALSESGSGLFMASAYLTIRADSEEALLNAAKTIKQRAKEQPARCEAVSAHFQQDEMAHSAAPLVYDALNKSTPMLGSALAKQMPFTEDNIYEPSGIETGIHATRDEPTIVDPFARGMGHNIMVFGKVGSGKSTTSKKIATQLKERNPDMNLVLIDPLEGLEGPSRLFDGERIVVGGETGLNPLEIQPTTDDQLDKLGETTPYSEALNRFMSFIETFYNLEGRDLDEKRGAWERAAKRAYQEKGITPDPATHDNESPTLADVLDKLRGLVTDSDAAVDDDLAGTGVADRIQTGAERITAEDAESFDPRGGRFGHFAKETGFDLNESGTTYLDLQLKEGKGKGESGLMIGLLLTSVYEIAKNSDEETLILIDEAQYLTKHADNLTFLEQVVRHSRHYDLSLLFSTQSISEFYTTDDDDGTSALRAQAEVIFNNSSMMCFHHLEEMNAELGGEIGLNPEESEFVNKALPGDVDRGYSEMLLAVDEDGSRECYPQRVEMDPDVNPVEFAIVDYEPSDHGDWHDFLERQLGKRFDGDTEGDEASEQHETDAPRTSVATDGGDFE